MKVIVRELIRAVALGAIIFVILYVIVNVSSQGFASANVTFGSFLFTMLYTILLYFINSVLFILLDRKFGKGRMTVKRFFIGFGLSFAVTLFCVFLLRILEDVVMEGATLQHFFATETIANYYFAMGITLIILLIIHAFHFYRRYQDNRVKKEKDNSRYGFGAV